MESRFIEADSIHLTRLGWEAIGMVLHEAVIKGESDEAQLERCIAGLAGVDWSRTNRDWFGMIGTAEQNPDGSHFLDANGRERVVITGGKGDQGLRRLITYLRKKTLPKADRAKGEPSDDMQPEIGEAA